MPEVKEIAECKWKCQGKQQQQEEERRTDKLFYAFGSDFSASIFSLYWLVLFSLCHQLASFMFLQPKSEWGVPVCVGGWVCVCLLSFRQGITTDLLRVCGYCLLPSCFFLLVFMQSFWAPSTHFVKSIFVLAINKPNRVCCGCVFPATQHSAQSTVCFCVCVCDCEPLYPSAGRKKYGSCLKDSGTGIDVGSGVEKRGVRVGQQPRQSML